MNHISNRIAISSLMCIATCAILVQPVHAQQRYTLDQGQWQKQTEYDPATPAGQLQQIRKMLAEGDADKAADRAKDWIEQYPGDPMLDEAYLIRGDAKAAQRRYFKALFDYEQLIRLFPASKYYETALEREFEIARLFASGMKRRWIGMRMLSAAGEAEEIFIRIQERLPGSELGERAMLELGDYYFNRSEMTSAADAYDLFLLNYPRSDYRERAMLRLIEANLATFKGPSFDPTGLIDAAQRIKEFQRDYPASAERLGSEALLVRINELLALKQESVANWYRRRRDAVSATYMYQRVVRDYPQTVAARNAADALRAMGRPVIAPPGSFDVSDFVDDPANSKPADAEDKS